MRILYTHRQAFSYSMKHLFALLYTLCLIAVVHAQRETDERVIGFKYLMKFNANKPQVEIKNTNYYNPFNTNYKGPDFTIYANSICDTLGNLLFYYDGSTVYRADGQVMHNGVLHPYNFNNYYVNNLIVPIEESNRRYYYVFETVPYIENWDFNTNKPVNCPLNQSCYEFYDMSKMQYHIIDMHANGGSGGIIKKNIFIADSIAPSISGVKHQNNIDTWVSVLKSRTNVVMNFKVNACSIDPPIENVIPDFEYTNQPYMAYMPKYGLGFQLVYSTAGDLVTFSGTQKSLNAPSSRAYTVFIAPFDAATGLFDFTALQTIPVESGGCVNLFSHDSRYLYYHDTWIFGSSVWTYQYDIASKISTPFYFNLIKNRYTGMDYGKENNILIYKWKGKQVGATSNFVGYLGEIKHIDQAFVPSNLVDSLPIPSYEQPEAIPSFTYIARNNYIYNFYHPNYKKPNAFPVAQSISNTLPSPACYDAPVTLKGTSNIPVDSLFWFVKKLPATSWQKYTDDTLNLNLSPGTYQASLVSYRYCLADSATQQFVLEDYPIISVAADSVYTCVLKTVDLPTTSTYAYQWYNAHAEPVAPAVQETGLYTLVVTNSCGSAKDSVYIGNSTLNVTNLITVNNDSKNDCMVAQSNNPRETISLSVYNSWGSRVFYDADYKNTWCPENELSDGVYFYETTYNNNCSQKGWVQIIH